MSNLFATKKDLDKHVRTGFAKLRTEHEKNLRGFSVAKLYAKLGEYTSALHYVSTYLSVKDDYAHAHRFAGQCYEKLNQPGKAIAAYERALQLDPKQSELLIEVCKLVLSDESLQSPGKLRYLCDLAEAQRIQDESVVNLKVKLLQRDNFTPQQVDEMLQKEIANKPSSVTLRIQMVKHMLGQNRLDDAFKYTFDLEQKQNEFFAQSLDWYNCVGQVLAKLAAQDLTSNWMYWLMNVSTIERQAYLTLCLSGSSHMSTTNLSDCAQLIFQFDQTLEKAVKPVLSLFPDQQMAQHFLAHYRGQLCLHAATLIFKRETIQKTHWREIQRNTLPLLLLAHNAGVVRTEDQWVNKSTESIKQLVTMWHRESSFRCLQAGRTILASVDPSKDNTVIANIRKICTEKMQCTTNAELLDQIRQYSSDTDWRRNIHRVLFTVSDQANKHASSFLVQSNQLADIRFELPQLSDLETNAESAQWLRPSSLDHQVYLALGGQSIVDFKSSVFEGLNLSVSNLINCGAETLNQLDVDSVLAATTIQTQLRLTTERSVYETGTQTNIKLVHRPFAIVAHKLSTEEQSNWWLAAYKVFKNLSTSEDFGEVRAVLQHGIEAIRGVGSPKMDLLICLKLGQLFVSRSQQPDTRFAEKQHLEHRAEALFKFSLHMIRMKTTGSLGQIQALFKYPTQNAFENDSTVNTIAEEAVTFLASRFFHAEEYQECIDELQNIQLPFATYFLAEAYRKLGQSSNTPKKSQRNHVEKAKEYLQQTLELLDYPHVDKNHALRSIVHDDIKSVQQQLSKVDVSFVNGTYNDDFLNDSTVSSSGRNRTRDARDNATQPKIDELKVIMMKMMETLTLVQDDVLAVRTRIGNIEEQMKRKQDAAEAASPYNARWEEDYMAANKFYASPYNPARPPIPVNPYSPFYNNQFPQMPIHPNVMNAPQQQRNPMMPQMPYGDPSLNMYNNPNIMGLLQQQPQFQTTPTAQLPPQSFTPMQMPSQPIQQQQAVFSTPLNHNAEPSSMFQLPVSAPAPAPAEVDVKVPPVNKNWNPTLNNAPVEKAPPVNVVITNSDPLPLQSTVPTTQPTLSVTIPSHHIKNNNTNVENPPPAQSTPLAFGGFIKTPTSLSKAAAPVDKSKTPAKPVKPAESVKPIEQTPAAVVPNKTVVSVEVPKKTAAPVEPTKTPVPFAVSKPITPIAVPKAKPTTTVPEKIADTKPSPFAALNFGKTPEPADKSTKPSPFANFSFLAPTTSTPFASLNTGTPFGSALNTSNTTTTTPTKVVESTASATPSKSTDADDADEYVPTAHFEPVIALPDLVETKTGEEEEHIRFEHRAKLLRFVKETKEWKERGLGQMKVLVNKADPNKVRLLMRREQVFKLCCNQLITKDTKFNALGAAGTSMTWYGQDYSENELQVELLAIRFKTAETCKEFHDAILEAQKQMVEGSSEPAKVEKEKPKEAAAPAAATIGFGDKFKPKTGSWDCGACYVTNKAADTKCLACNSASPNAPAAAAPAKAAAPAAAAVPAPKAGSGFGDLFKPKAGTWECKGCYISNKTDALYCVACNSPKDDTVPAKPKEHSLLATSAGAPKFTFGVKMTTPTAAVVGQEATVKDPVTTTTTAGGAFSFGTFTAMSSTTTPNTSVFASPVSSSTPAKPLFGGFAFGSSKVESPLAAAPKPAAVKPAPIVLDKPAKEDFSFVFKPKSPTKVKSPPKNYPSGTEDVSDDENIEEENNTYFTPAIPLPDKVDVVTGEENETLLYSHRAKLYRFVDSEWKERGLGDVKILKHKTSGKMRVVMRREQILKICLNHALTDEIEYQPKDDKSWHFVANDFSEGEVELMQFCLRFKTAEIANGFKDAAAKALAGTLVNAVAEDLNGDAAESGATANISDEDKRLADSLKLPAAFFSYKTASDCAGCRGCQTPEFKFAEVKPINTDVTTDDNPIPLKHPGRRTTPPTATLPPVSKVENTPAKTFASAPTLFGGLSTVGNASPFGFKPTAEGASVFGNANTSIFGQTNIFGNATVTPSTDNGAKPLPTKSFSFGSPAETASPFKALGNTKSEDTFSFKSTGLFGQATPFGGDAAKTNSPFGTAAAVGAEPVPVSKSFSFTNALGSIANDSNPSSTSKSDAPKSIFGGAAVFKSAESTDKKAPSIFGNLSTPASSTFSFGQVSSAPTKSSSTSETATSHFKDSGLSFASLATNSPNTSNSSNLFSSPSTGFIGLSKANDFSSFSKPPAANLNGSGHDESAGGGEDPTYDPHYEPIIELPDEIVVRTGEEDEEKVFGERAKLFRYDTTNREWKERGVGEMKILHHAGKNTYRMLMRREQVHKCVLNHALNGDFAITPMQSSDKAFCWATNNFADDPAGVAEQLSVRFKNAEIAGTFDAAVKKCMSQLKLEPEDD